MKNIKIRPVTIDDAKEILKIYEYYVLNTAISFEYSVPTAEEFERRIKKTLENYPYYAAIYNDKIVGYAYAGTFVGREAYRFSAELSIYIDKDYRKNGIGKLLYNTIENKLHEMGITNFYACIAPLLKKKMNI